MKLLRLGMVTLVLTVEGVRAAATGAAAEAVLSEVPDRHETQNATIASEPVVMRMRRKAEAIGLIVTGSLRPPSSGKWYGRCQ